MSKRSVQVPLDQARSQEKRTRRGLTAAKEPSPGGAGVGRGAQGSRRGASAFYGQEDKATIDAQPSRKSTRRSAHHLKAAPLLKAKRTIALNAPTARRGRGS